MYLSSKYGYFINIMCWGVELEKLSSFKLN